MNLYEIKNAYLKVLLNESEAVAGSMSSGPVLDASVSDPQHGVYGLWNSKTKEKKKFKTDVERRNFKNENSDWEDLD